MSGLGMAGITGPDGPSSVGVDRERFALKYCFLYFPPCTGETSMTYLRAAAAKFVRADVPSSTLFRSLLLALIAVVCIAGMTVLGTKINSMFQTLSTSI